MNQERLLQVILAPIVSEKSTMIAEKNQQMAFRVAKDATKPEIKAAVEMLFNVKLKAFPLSMSKARLSALAVPSVVAVTGKGLR